MKGNAPKTSIVSGVFSLDYPNYRILDYFGKHGKSNRNQVGKHNIRYSPLLSEKQIGRRVESLEQLGYLQQTEIKKIGNLKDRVEKVYDLTFKGFLASLHYCTLEENQFFMKYMKFMIAVDKWQDENTNDVLYGKANKISPIITKIINFQLEHFFYHNYTRGISLDSMKDIPSWFDVYDNSHGIPNKNLKLLEKHQDKIIKLFDELEYNNGVNSKYHQDVFLWTTNWVHVISFISQGITNNKILLKLRKNFPSEFITRIRKEKEKEFGEKMARLQEIDRTASDIFYMRK